ATTVVGPFSSGDTSPVNVTSTKTIQSKSSSLGLKVTDVAGNVTVCDPVWGGSKALRHAKRSRHAHSHRARLLRPISVWMWRGGAW
ncbi:MAG: hypothetical protein ACRDQZ_06135, partial [Mycobacteriales bacterium]